MALKIGRAHCSCGGKIHGTKLIALTGGPGAGKTAVLETATQVFCEHVAILPEAASVVFGGGFPRHETEAGLRASQRAIYHVQRAIERLVVEEGRVAIALCDRGTVDGGAYWPGPQHALWSDLGTSLRDELSRYVAVIHMRTPPADSGYNQHNALRIESADQARVLDRAIERAWSAHPRRYVVESTADFFEKAHRALEIVRAELPTCCHAHPLPARTS